MTHDDDDSKGFNLMAAAEPSHDQFLVQVSLSPFSDKSKQTARKIADPKVHFNIGTITLLV